MNSLNEEIILAYNAICRGFQLDGQEVLQAFADQLSVLGYLASDIGTKEYYVNQVFSGFTKSYPPVYPLNPVKRRRGIFHMRSLVKIDRSSRSGAEKEKAYEELCDQWFWANDVQGDGKKLWLNQTLYIIQPKGMLLLCDLFRCRPLDLLYFFIEEVILQMKHSNSDGMAFQFLLHRVANRYSICNN